MLKSKGRNWGHIEKIFFFMKTRQINSRTNKLDCVICFLKSTRVKNKYLIGIIILTLQ